MCSSFNRLENVVNCSRNDTLILTISTLHCVSFPCSSLTICENCAIVSFQNWLDNRQCCVVKDRLLFAVWSEYRVIREISNSGHIGLLGIGIFNTNFSVIFKYLDHKLMIIRDLVFIGRPASYNDLDSLCLGRSFDFRWHLSCLRKCFKINFKNMNRAQSLKKISIF